ncbi:MAG: NUDIX domain-containing protein [Roseicyclus sp.]
MNRRFGRPPRADRRYMARPGVYAIVDAGDGLLATFQEEPRPELQLPGGGIDPGESPRAALAREVLEETGYTIHGLRRIGMFHRYTYMPEYDLFAQKQCHVYAARLGLRRSGYGGHRGNARIRIGREPPFSQLHVAPLGRLRLP